MQTSIENSGIEGSFLPFRAVVTTDRKVQQFLTKDAIFFIQITCCQSLKSVSDHKSEQ